MLTWAIILLFAALVLFVVEVFIPSGGIIGAVATIALAAGLGCLFMIDQTTGLIATLIVLILAPFAIGFSVKIFPNTPIGRLLTLSESQQRGPAVDPAPDADESELVGAEGVAEKELRPVGACRINGRRVECHSEIGLIEPGTRVRVTAVDGMHIKVRPVEDR